MEEPGRPQMRTWCIRIACWILKNTNTHSDYVLIYCFSTVTKFARKCTNITLYSHCLFCLFRSFLLLTWIRSQLHLIYWSRLYISENGCWNSTLPAFLPAYLHIIHNSPCRSNPTPLRLYLKGTSKSKAIPAQAWIDPESFRRLGLPYFKTNSIWRW
jgi:hypothetical protein